MKHKTLLLFIACLSLLAFASIPASAQLLFDNGSAALGSGGYGYYADAGNTFYTEAGDVFTATSSGTANYIEFAGLYYGGTTPTTDSFTLSLYSTSAGAPDTLLTTSVLSTVSRTVLGAGESQTVYEFSSLLETPLTLNAGTAYYLGISDTSNPFQDFAVDVSGAVPSGGSTSEYSLASGTTTFFATGPDALSFQLQAVAVPEPSEWALLVLGGIGLAVARNFRPRFSRG